MNLNRGAAWPIMAKLILSIVACALVVGCNRSNQNSVPRGSATTATIHLAFRTTLQQDRPTSTIVQVNRSLIYRSMDAHQNNNYISLDILKDFDDPANTPNYRLDITIEGSSGVSGLPNTAMTGINADLIFFVSNVVPGETYKCSSGSTNLRNQCWPQISLYSTGKDQKNAFGKVTAFGTESLFDPQGNVTCTLAISKTSAQLKFVNEGKSPYHRDYYDVGELPSGPGNFGSPNKHKPYGFAFRCVNSKGKNLLYLTYTQNGASIPSI